MKNRNNKGQFIKGYHPPTEFKKGDKGHLGYRHSIESRRKIGEGHKGQIPWNKGKRIKKICQNCGKEFSVIPFYSTQKFCSHPCASILNGFKKGHKDFNTLESIEKNRKAHLGKKHNEESKQKMGKAKERNKNPNWKNGVVKSGGYIWILKPNHLKANGKYVKRASLVAEKHLGRLLTKQEVIHHINGIKDDDRPENLYLFSSNSGHMRFEKLKNKPNLISNIL
jgi:endogenous inhibitor of DNA gyrase (YacG/DUF329 family)